MPASQDLSSLRGLLKSGILFVLKVRLGVWGFSENIQASVGTMATHHDSSSFPVPYEHPCKFKYSIASTSIMRMGILESSAITDPPANSDKLRFKPRANQGPQERHWRSTCRFRTTLRPSSALFCHNGRVRRTRVPQVSRCAVE